MDFFNGHCIFCVGGISIPRRHQILIKRPHQIIAADGDGDEVGGGNVDFVVVQLLQQLPAGVAINSHIHRVVITQFLRHLIGKVVGSRQPIAAGDAVTQSQIDRGVLRRQRSPRQQAQTQGQGQADAQNSSFHFIVRLLPRQKHSKGRWYGVPRSGKGPWPFPMRFVLTLSIPKSPGGRY